jgi:hypothetical protein
MAKQRHTSAGTCLNQVPGVFRLINKTFERPHHFWTYTDDVLDYGGGRFDTFTDHLGKMGVRNWVYDPYNRTDAHNDLVRKMLTVKKADAAVCSNVLNVVKEPTVRRAILEDIRMLTSPGGSVFITVHEGNRTSRGRKTKRGWQANRPTRNYLREIRKVFPGAFVCHGGKLIYAEVPAPTT